jgi:putative transposase
MPNDLGKHMQATIRDAQMEAGRCWTEITAFHADRRLKREKWPTRDDLQKLTKGKYKLHSQTVQMICHQLLANVDATTERRRSEPGSRRWLRYPYKEKRFFPLYWPEQAISYTPSKRRLTLPMGRGRKSLVFRLDLDFTPGAVKLVWNEGVELHIVRTDVTAMEPSGTNRATVDLGEIHQAAAVTNTGEALVVSGRGIRSHKRLLTMQLGEISAKRSRCTKGSRRHRRLQKVRQKRSLLSRRRVRDLRHKGTRKIIDFCRDNKVGSLFIGNPHGVRNRDSGRHHNQRMARWEYGVDIDYLEHKSERAGISSFTGDERGTSSRCPECNHRHKPKGRVWTCKKCGFRGHRDVVGGVNMHQNAYSAKVTFPASVTYLRPGPCRHSAAAGAQALNSPAPAPARSSSPGTGHREASQPLAPMLLGSSPPQGVTSGGVPAPGSPGRRKTRRHVA